MDDQSSRNNASHHAHPPMRPARRRFFKATGAALASTALGSAGAAAATGASSSPVPAGMSTSGLGPATPPGGHNILFILVDQERHFDRWPFPVPGRERLMREGVSFANHQIAACVCSPSRSVIYTGQHMQHTGIFDNAGLPWQPDMSTHMRTVGHMMRDAGYRTAYFGKWHLSGTMHASNSPYDAPVRQYRQTMAAYGFDEYFGPGDLVGSAHGGYNYDGVTTEAAISWLRNRPVGPAGKKPWFLAVNLVNPHDVMWLDDSPAGAPRTGLLPTRAEPADRLYASRWPAAVPASYRQALNAPGRPAAHAMYNRAHDALIGRFDFSEASVRRYQDYYFNCIRDCDRHVERLLAELDDLGLERDTIVVLTSDHGDLAGAHHMIDKGANAYREQNHVPLIVRHPAYPGGKTCRALTSHVDLAPTLLALTGASDTRLRTLAGADAVGHSFAHLLHRPEAAPLHAVRPAALFNYAMLLYYDSEWMLAEFNALRAKGVPPAELHRRAAALQPNLHLRGAIRSAFDGRYRFTRYFALADFNRPATPAQLFAHNDVELYDLQQDPAELNNLARQPGQAGDLLMAMNDTLNRLIDTEVGNDSLASLPFVDGQLQFHFREHAAARR